MKVKGKCPSCGSKSLVVGKGNYLVCTWIECDNPTAASEKLSCYKEDDNE